MMQMNNFDNIFSLVSAHEGNFNDDTADPGNWTGGAVGAGSCRGTKFGISAAAYPDIDIANLTLDQAKSLYQRDYWDRISGDQLPAALALVVFDAAINNGAERAVSWLQSVVHVERDGIVGQHTLAAVDQLANAPNGIADLCSEFLTQRLMFMASLASWKTFGLGWARRLFELSFETLPYLEQ
jgi:lysozyme family protein